MGSAPVKSTSLTPKPATQHTIDANQVYRDGLPFSDDQDFKDASRGWKASLPDPAVITNGQGTPIWDLPQYEFLGSGPQDDAPDTVNPSLWRMAKLNMLHGLFEVVDGIWQVRGYDLSVMTIIRSDNGVIVVDPFISEEVAKKVWQDLVVPTLGDHPIKAVIYTHSHVDHYGGVRGLVDQASVDAKRVQIVAPDGFTEAAVGENVIAGNVMSRRATYMYGNLIPKNETGQVDGGLGKTSSSGTVTLIVPTDIVTGVRDSIELDGLTLDIVMAPESEAPAEFMFYLPKYKAFCTAEDATHTLHNLYTLRGAKVRDGLRWSKYLQEALDRFGSGMEVVFASHHWPTWDNGRAVAYLKKQRDTYRYLHDQTLRMANSGMTPREIGDAMRLPDTLAGTWACRSYYGSVYHDTVAQYNLRLGFFDGVPANLHQHQPTESGKRYVKFMGGPHRLLAQARESFEEGDYRWVAEVVNHLVFADENNEAARHLLADAYEQLGYQSESGPWRNFYLTGALELRNGVDKLPVPGTASADTICAMPLDMFFDYLGVRLNGDRAAGETVNFNLELTDTGETLTWGVENAAIHYSVGRKHPEPDASLTMTRTMLNEVMMGTTNLAQQIHAGNATLTGDPKKLAGFLLWLDKFEFWFPIVTP